MFKSSVALILSALIGLLGIGFIPAWILLSHKGIELEGILIILLSYVMWIPGIFVSYLIFKILIKTFKVIKPPKKTIMITLVLINFLSVFSVYPGLQIYITAKQSLVENKNEIEIKILQDSIIEYKDPNYPKCQNCTHAFQFKIELTNQTNKPIDNALSKIKLVFLSDYNWIKFLPAASTTNYENLTIPSNGSVVLEGKAPFTPSRTEATKNASDFPVKILVAIKYDGATFDTEYFLDPDTSTVSDTIELWNTRE